MGKRAHYNALDLLRGTSALLIVLYHWTYRFNENTLNVNDGLRLNYPIEIPFGCAAVVTFFMLSGFLVGKYVSSVQKDKAVGYFGGRLIRLYPTFWVGVCLTQSLMILLWPAAAVSFVDFILNFTMLPAVLHVKSVDGAYWTMQIEIIFSVIFSIVILIRSVKLRWLFLNVWQFLCLGLYILMNGKIPGIATIVLISPFSYMFLGGIAIYNIVFGNRNIYAYILLTISTIGCFILSETIAHLLFFLGTGIILICTKRIDFFIKESNVFVKAIKWVASISYPLYLIHQMIGFAIIRLFYNYGITSEFILVIAFLCCSALAWLIHKYIEMPTAIWAGKIAKKL